MGLQPGSIGDFLYLYCHANSLMGLQSGTPVYNGFCTNKLYPSRHEFDTDFAALFSPKHMLLLEQHLYMCPFVSCRTVGVVDNTDSS